MIEPDGVRNAKRMLTETREAPSSLRGQYIGLIKGIKPLSGVADTNQRRDLTPDNQSLLYLLRNVEAININREDAIAARSVEGLEKVPLMLRVAKELGHRPESTSFSIDNRNDRLPKYVEDFIMTHQIVFIKANKSYRGEDVFMVIKRDDGIFLMTSANPRTQVSEKSLDRIDSSSKFNTLSELILPPNLYIVEDEIEIAPAENEATGDISWEIRHLPPFPAEYSYAKVSSEVAQFLNNISKGGKRANAKQIVMNVIKRGGTDDPNLVEAQAVEFLAQSQQLSQRVKELTDEIQIEAARQIIKPGDLKDPTAYEDVMRACFSGTFLAVDITGVWDRTDQLGRLKPMIMEAQTSAGLPGEPESFLGIIGDKNLLKLGIPTDLAYLAYKQSLDALTKKISTLQLALK